MYFPICYTVSDGWWFKAVIKETKSQKSAPTRSYVKVLISLVKEKEEAMKEMLTQDVHTYLKFNDNSRDEPHQAITHFTVHLINVYKVRLVTLGVNSVRPLGRGLLLFSSVWKPR